MNTSTSSAAPARHIVIAWTETVQVWDGEAFAADLGHRAGLVDETVAKACTWLREGSQADIRRAEDHARTIPNARVYTFKAGHREPHAAAKRSRPPEPRPLPPARTGSPGGPFGCRPLAARRPP